jgi:hypothetical protein
MKWYFSKSGTLPRRRPPPSRCDPGAPSGSRSAVAREQRPTALALPRRRLQVRARLAVRGGLEGAHARRAHREQRGRAAQRVRAYYRAARAPSAAATSDGCSAVAALKSASLARPPEKRAARCADIALKIAPVAASHAPRKTRFTKPSAATSRGCSGDIASSALASVY